MLETNSTHRAEETQSELRSRIEVLQDSLQQELNARTALEFELYEIKSSLAWRLLFRYRTARNKLLAEGTRRRKVYETLRDALKLVLLLRRRASGLTLGAIPKLVAKGWKLLRTEGIDGLRRQLRNEIDGKHEYTDWIEKYDTITDATRASIRRHLEALSYRPRISVIMPVYNTPEQWLHRAIVSVKSQIYPDWELCIADDASFQPAVTQILEEYASNDARIKIAHRTGNGHISAASNTAIEMATGEFIAFLDHDDELSEHALYLVAVELNRHSDAGLIYSDEDKIDEAGRRYGPYFKPDWNPALFVAQNFICHLAVYRTEIVRRIGGLRLGYEGAQDWDLALRVSETIPPSCIRHIPHVLYHWRAVAGSTAVAVEEKNYAKEAQRKTVQSHFERIGKTVSVLPAGDQYWRIKYALPDPPPKVSIIIPTRNGFGLLYRCLESIFTKTIYDRYELIVVDNQSDDPKTLDYLTQLERERSVRVLRYDAPFNYAAINNFAVQHATGEIVALLNNDLEVIARDWLQEMVSYAGQPEIGAVGAMLYFPNDTIQHAGVVLGIGSPPPGVAGHIYKNYSRGHSGQATRALLCQDMSAVTAACLVVRRAVFEQVGGFDEKNLPIAFNDVDFCLRLKERGYRNIWTPYAELYHYESASRGYENTPEKRERFEIEKQYMMARWHKVLLNDPAYNPNLALDRAPFTLSFPPRVQKPWLELIPNKSVSVSEKEVLPTEIGASPNVLPSHDLPSAVEHLPSPNSLPDIVQWAQSFDVNEKPWLILGKGPSYQHVRNARLGDFYTCSLNHVVREQRVDLAHIIDIDVVTDCIEAIDRNARHLALPFFPHVNHTPTAKSIIDFLDEIPLLAKLEKEGRLLWFNLSTSKRAAGSSPVIAAKFFSAESAINILVECGAKTIRSLGVDGGNTYASHFDDLKTKTLLANTRTSFDEQFRQIANTIRTKKILYAPLHLEAPIRIFVGTDTTQILPARVLEYSIRKHASMSVDFYPMCELPVPLPKDPQNRPRTGFSFSRFLIPSLCGYRGSAIYFDADMLVLGDVAKLWGIPMADADVICAEQPSATGRVRQYSVMRLNCSNLRWKIDEIVAGLDAGQYNYRQLMHDFCLVDPEKIAATIPSEWNSLEHYDSGKTCLIHYTDMPTQPWVSFENPNGAIWYETLREAIAERFILKNELYQEVEQGHVLPDLPQRLGLAPHSNYERLAREFVPPYKQFPQN